MSQRAFLAELDAEIFTDLAEEGMADTGTYTGPAPGAVAVAARVYVDKTAQSGGENLRAHGGRVTVTILRADVAEPAQGGIVEVDGESWRLSRPSDKTDDGVSVWVVTPA